MCVRERERERKVLLSQKDINVEDVLVTMAGATGAMRGLSLFIADIRSSPNKEAERARVDKELANIRTKFKSEKQLTPYDRKKYVWKMLYIYMLGYDVDFGHMEAVGLISASR